MQYAESDHNPVRVIPWGCAMSALKYQLIDGSGGVIIDPDGIESAVATLNQQFGVKLDQAALKETLESIKTEGE